MPVPLGSEAAWRRGFDVKSALLWSCRSEIPALIDTLDLRRVQDWVTAFSEDAATSCPTLPGALSQTRRSVLAALDSHNRTLRAPDPRLVVLRPLLAGEVQCDPLQGIFDALAAKAAAVYGGVRRITPNLRRQWLNGHPTAGAGAVGPPPDPYHVDATTSAQSTTAEVFLNVHLHGFDACSFVAVPALFVHELICHAYAQNDVVNNESPWAEGVMDWTATHYFLPRFSFDLDLPTGDVIRHGRAIRNHRSKGVHVIGERATNELIRWLPTADRLYGDYDAAAAKVARFTIEVNATPDRLAAKDRLASRLCRLRADPVLQAGLRGWVAGAVTPQQVLDSS
jgi:hypothetical protein